MWVNNKMDFGGIGWCGMDRIGLAQDRATLVDAVMNLRVP
jgi:hypothetical protein